jgi:hypothetical protein
VADLDAGIPAVLALVTVASASPAALSANHQALAYGYEAWAAEVTVRVHDPCTGSIPIAWHLTLGFMRLATLPGSTG